MSQFVERYRHGAEWEYDHPLEKRALERGYGIIVWQEQVVQIIQDVAEMTAAEADEVRRAFTRPNSEHLIAMHRERFLEGARRNGVTEETAMKIFGKINGHYMFPESHSHAFGVTAYQAAWLKCSHREALWEAGLRTRPPRNGQSALPVSMQASVPRIPDFTDREKMIGEYQVMSIYPGGHLMEFVRPGVGSTVLTTFDVEGHADDEMVKVAGWPVARQHPRGRDGTVFVTIEDETGDAQVIVWRDLFARRRRELSTQMVEVTGRVSRWDETINVIATDLRAIRSGVVMPPSHGLALTLIPVSKDCSCVWREFIIDGRCVVDTV